MTPIIMVLNADLKESQEIGSLLEQAGYVPVVIHRKEDLYGQLKVLRCLTVILDVDTIRLDNREIKELTRKFPNVSFLCTSKDPFHPELKEAICNHIYACLKKPVDPDELFYWLKSIRESEAELRDPPTT
jgi:DNA-binding NtrC family response regulator